MSGYVARKHENGDDIDFGPVSKVPTLTHYGMVWFQNRALAKATSRLCPYLD